MIRRLPVVAAALAAMAALSSCSTFDPPAATVGGSEISPDVIEAGLKGFEEMLPETAAAIGVDSVAGSGFSGDTGRFWLTYVIRHRIADQALARLGGAITDEDRRQGENLVAGDPTASDLPPVVQQEIIANIAANSALGRATGVPTPAQLEVAYAAQPASTGALCVRHLVVRTRAEAVAALEEVRAGAAFADVAAARSVEPNAATTGGALTVTDNPCVALRDLLGSIDPDFMAAALAARPGVPTEPVQSTSGWHIILARPWGEIGEGLTQIVTEAPAIAALYAGYVTTPVSVASEFGQWDPVRYAVVPLD